MSSRTTTSRLDERAAIKTILLATLVAGTLDALAAIINFSINGGKNPVRIFYFIASGVFGREAAYSGGTLMAICGLLFHFLIAFLFSLFLFLIYPKLKQVLKNKFLIGLLYGVFIWLVMNKIVLPLSKAPKLPPDLKRDLIGMLILMFLVGLPIALIVDRHYSGGNDKAVY